MKQPKNSPYFLYPLCGKCSKGYLGGIAQIHRKSDPHRRPKHSLSRVNRGGVDKSLRTITYHLGYGIAERRLLEIGKKRVPRKTTQNKKKD